MPRYFFDCAGVSRIVKSVPFLVSFEGGIDPWVGSWIFGVGAAISPITSGAATLPIVGSPCSVCATGSAITPVSGTYSAFPVVIDVESGCEYVAGISPVVFECVSQPVIGIKVRVAAPAIATRFIHPDWVLNAPFVVCWMRMQTDFVDWQRTCSASAAVRLLMLWTDLLHLSQWRDFWSPVMSFQSAGHSLLIFGSMRGWCVDLYKAFRYFIESIVPGSTVLTCEPGTL